MKASRELTFACLAVLLALIVAWAGGQQGRTLGSVPVIVICTLTAFAVQWIVFIHAWHRQTEQFFDLTGSLTYLTVLLMALVLGNGEPRSLLIALLVSVWAVRLGSFLFKRVRQSGHDRRFNDIKTEASTFFMTWTLQGLWVSLTLACGLAAMTTLTPEPLGLYALIGGIVWLVGFTIEVAADQQKRRFRADPALSNQFISSGLWAWSRHPNYFGEIVLWIGIAIIAMPVLQGWQWLTLVSPLFVYVLLTRISGIRMLEHRADRVWGNEASYQAYKASTPLLIPRAPTGSG